MQVRLAGTGLPIDVVLYLDERLDAGLDELARRAGKQRRQCDFPHENKGLKEVLHGTSRAPTTEQLMMALRTKPQLVRRLCEYLMADFLCFGFELPSECAVGRGASQSAR